MFDENTLNVHDLHDAFFMGMLNGYAGNGVKGSIPELSAKVTTWKEGHYTLVDHWHTTKLSRKSFGTTTISFDANIVWKMQYWGEYKDEVIPFLKEALAYAYSKGLFIGGRGPYRFEKNGLLYVNVPIVDGLEDFRGKETVVNEAGHVQGWHEYCGMQTWRNGQ
jgi:hypothetical protein